MNLQQNVILEKKVNIQQEENKVKAWKDIQVEDHMPQYLQCIKEEKEKEKARQAKMKSRR